MRHFGWFSNTVYISRFFGTRFSFERLKKWVQTSQWVPWELLGHNWQDHDFLSGIIYQLVSMSFSFVMKKTSKSIAAVNEELGTIKKCTDHVVFWDLFISLLIFLCIEESFVLLLHKCSLVTFDGLVLFNCQKNFKQWSAGLRASFDQSY